MTELNYEFTLSRDSSEIIVIDPDNSGVVAKIALPEGSNPNSAALTNDNSRYYVPLTNKGEVAVVSGLTLSMVDLDGTTPEFDSIKISNNEAKPSQITIHPNGNYAYVTDSNELDIYVLDIAPGSPTYHQHIQTINLTGSNDSKLRKLAISSDGLMLFVTQSTDTIASSKESIIIAINIDASNPDETSFHKIVATSDTVEVSERVFGISSTPSLTQMAVTFRRTYNDGGGYAFLSYEYSDSENPNPANGVTLTLGERKSVAMGNGDLTGAWDPIDIEVVKVSIPESSINVNNPSSLTTFSETNPIEDKIAETYLTLILGLAGGPFTGVDSRSVLNRLSESTMLVVKLKEIGMGMFEFTQNRGFITPQLVAAGTDIELVNKINLEKIPQSELKLAYAGKNATLSLNLKEIAIILEQAEVDETLAAKLKKIPLEFLRKGVLLDTVKGAILDFVAIDAIEIAADYFENRFREQAATALLDFAEKVPGRPWDITVPSSHPQLF
jgi:DNA-binding beta-propeller fold protein YncE